MRDQWDYAAGPSRKSGFSVNTGIDNNIDRNKTMESDPVYDMDTFSWIYSKSTTTSNIYKAGGFLRIDYFKPLKGHDFFFKCIDRYVLLFLTPIKNNS